MPCQKLVGKIIDGYCDILRYRHALGHMPIDKYLVQFVSHLYTYMCMLPVILDNSGVLKHQYCVHYICTQCGTTHAL